MTEVCRRSQGSGDKAGRHDHKVLDVGLEAAQLVDTRLAQGKL